MFTLLFVNILELGRLGLVFGIILYVIFENKNISYKKKWDQTEFLEELYIIIIIYV